jgi:predicted 3-demethylubiquinone-9 3-methyltransferase (glyoxalase superfamily)
LKGITSNLWFDHQAEEAANFYVSIFPSSKVGRVTRYSSPASEVAGQLAGAVMTVEFELNGMPFIGLNGGPMFKFTEAISFVVNCESQEEIDHFWSRLSEGGSEEQCGWLKDRFGVSWQVVPTELGKLLSTDRARSERVMAALLKMKKLDLPVLRAAYEGT